MNPMMNDPNAMMGLLNNPAIAQSVASMMRNPQLLDSLVASNPALASMMTPEMRQLMQSEQFVSMMSNPLFMQSMMGMGGMGGGAAMPGLGGFGMPAVPPAQPAANQQPPEERFQVQLQQLREMGFFDAAENIRVLTMTNGNVEAAIEILFSRR